MSDNTVRITEIFFSLQGETSTCGRPTVFVRLTGCPLRCQYCDTEYAFYGGEKRTLADVVDQVATYQAAYVTVTGGEPLAQPSCLPLLTSLCDQGYRVSLETSGALAIDAVDPRVAVILDLKTPGSGEVKRNLWSNIALLKASDEVKFVVCGRQDYDWARLKLDELALGARGVEILFSPSHGQLEPRQLAEWILADNLPVRMQMQLHKQLWGDVAGK